MKHQQKLKKCKCPKCGLEYFNPLSAPNLPCKYLFCMHCSEPIEDIYVQLVEMRKEIKV